MKHLFCLATLALATANAQNAVNPPGDHRTMCIFLDFSSMNAQDQLRAQQAAVAFVEGKVTSNDTVVIMTFTSELRTLQNFTADRSALVTALRSIIPIDSGEVDPSRKLSAIQDAAKVLAPIPGKKTMMYFSGGIPKTDTLDQAGLDAAVNALKVANVSVYSADARALLQ